MTGKPPRDICPIYPTAIPQIDTKYTHTQTRKELAISSFCDRQALPSTTHGNAGCPPQQRSTVFIASLLQRHRCAIPALDTTCVQPAYHFLAAHGGKQRRQHKTMASMLAHKSICVTAGHMYKSLHTCKAEQVQVHAHKTAIRSKLRALLIVEYAWCDNRRRVQGACEDYGL